MNGPSCSSAAAATYRPRGHRFARFGPCNVATRSPRFVTRQKRALAKIRADQEASEFAALMGGALAPVGAPGVRPRVFKPGSRMRSQKHFYNGKARMAANRLRFTGLATYTTPGFRDVSPLRAPSKQWPLLFLSL